MASKKPKSAQRYNVLSPHSYEHHGETKTGWTEVGIAFDSKDGEGVNVEIRPGLAVSGRLIIRPWNDHASAGTGESAVASTTPPDVTSFRHSAKSRSDLV